MGFALFFLSEFNLSEFHILKFEKRSVLCTTVISLETLLFLCFLTCSAHQGCIYLIINAEKNTIVKYCTMYCRLLYYCEILFQFKNYGFLF